jgi:hypothetical protein
VIKVTKPYTAAGCGDSHGCCILARKWLDRDIRDWLELVELDDRLGGHTHNERDWLDGGDTRTLQLPHESREYQVGVAVRATRCDWPTSLIGED